MSFHLLTLITDSVYLLPTPTSITSLWNLGFLLSLTLSTQLCTGLLLAMHYSSSTATIASDIISISNDITYGWTLRTIHANIASLFFFLAFIHVGRGLYFYSYKYTPVWNLGVVILLTLIATAFLGYVLPWGQISYWGATVITNLLSAVPYIGSAIVTWVWGGFSVSGVTLCRFFTLHYLLPFAILLLTILHLYFLHTTGSSNPLSIITHIDKVTFHPYYSLKDLFFFTIVFLLTLLVAIRSPWLTSDPENFIPANPILTPVHIKPEWYFLFAYAILRAVPNKLGGVIGLVLAVLVLLLPAIMPVVSYPTLVHHTLLWWLVVTFLALRWVGGHSVEDPYVIIRQLLRLCYFGLFGLLVWVSS